MKWLVTILYWLQVFVSPVVICALIGFAIGRETVLWILQAPGVLMGIMMAEYIRRKTGLSIFFARLYSNPPQGDADIKKNNHATTNH